MLLRCRALLQGVQVLFVLLLGLRQDSLAFPPSNFFRSLLQCRFSFGQIQGDENSVALAAQQTFPAVEQITPVPPEVGCPDETVWDITIREQAEGQPLPVGTVVCLIQELGNHPAIVIEPNKDPFDANLNTNQPNVANCNAPDQQRAQVTSGTPSNPLSIGSFLCATLMD